MTRGPGAAGAPHPFSDEELAWVRAHLTQLRQSVSGQRLVVQILGIGFALGLAAHVGGYVLRSSATTGLLGLVAGLLYARGWALWIGVVVAMFVGSYNTSLPCRPRFSVSVTVALL
jgi:hypothetical protein